MRRRDFIRAVGLGCMGCLYNPLAVLADNSSKGTVARGVSSLVSRTYDTKKLLNKYDAQAQARREMYLPVFGEARIDSILAEMRESYEALIPNIPFIGERNYHLQWFIPNAEKLAEYIVARNYDVSVKDFSTMYIDKTKKDLYAMPENTRLMIGKMQFGPVSQMQQKFAVFKSQFKLYPDDYILTYIKGDGETFDYGLDYTQCASDKLYKQYDAMDMLINLICNMDYCRSFFILQ
ncbi:MAG: hypothetical protein NTV89_17815 [Proteobacteria bacterium]|nr:hypothetical protein [Pseudomonadota bacterium]